MGSPLAVLGSNEMEMRGVIRSISYQLQLPREPLCIKHPDRWPGLINDSSLDCSVLTRPDTKIGSIQSLPAGPSVRQYCWQHSQWLSLSTTECFQLYSNNCSMFDCEVLSANICFLSNFPSFICSDSHLEFPQLYSIVHQIPEQNIIIPNIP